MSPCEIDDVRFAAFLLWRALERVRAMSPANLPLCDVLEAAYQNAESAVIELVAASPQSHTVLSVRVRHNDCKK